MDVSISVVLYIIFTKQIKQDSRISKDLELEKFTGKNLRFLETRSWRMR